MGTSESTTTERRPHRGRPRRRGGTAALAAGLAAACTLVIPGPAAGASATAPNAAEVVAQATPPVLPYPDSNGIDMTAWVPAPGHADEEEDDWRLLEATMITGSVYRNGATPEIKVRILLPPNYQTDPNDPYDVLWLLHGGTGSYDGWTSGGLDAQAAVSSPASDFDGIVVMPEGGSTGYYTDWWGQADNGASPAWETFHIDELLPWVDDNFNTDASAGGRAIAGLSMGGFGALKYAGQHPDLFSSVGSFSGATNIRLDNSAIGGSADVGARVSEHMFASGACIRTINCLDLATRVNLYTPPWPWPDPDQALQEAYRMETLFGPPSNYPNVNPFDMAAEFASYDEVALFTGGENTGERDMYHHNEVFRAELQDEGLNPYWCAGDGDHSATYWQPSLVDFLELVYGTDPAPCHYTEQ